MRMSLSSLFSPRSRCSLPPKTLFGLALVVLMVIAPSSAAQPTATVQGVTLTVDNLDRAVPFYRNVLRFEVVDTAMVTDPSTERLFGVFGSRLRTATLQLGDERITLLEFVAPDTGRPYPPDARSNDRWFQHVAIIVSDMEAAYARLRNHGVTQISPAPQTLPGWNPDAGGISAFYFKDPSGNPLEILHFPPDKGADKWHRDTDALFMGIDHTAIAVDDTKESLALYRDRLGFAVAGTSTNYGREQERLTGVFGARVRITALRAPGGGMGVEFLEYVAPSDGCPTPPDTRANDLWHGHIRIATETLAARVDTLMQRGYDFVSPAVQTLPTDALGFRRGALLRDPDGHGLLLTAPASP